MNSKYVIEKLVSQKKNTKQKALIFMITRQTNDIASIDANKHRGVLIKWLPVIVDRERKYSAIRVKINSFLWRMVLARQRAPSWRNLTFKGRIPLIGKRDPLGLSHFSL